MWYLALIRLAIEGLDSGVLQDILETGLTSTTEGTRETSAFEAVGLLLTPASIPTLIATKFKYKTSTPMLRALLQRLMAQSVAANADPVVREDILEYWSKHVRAKVLEMAMQMFAVQCDATNQESRAQAMVDINIKVIPVEVVRMWLDGSGASLGVDSSPPGAASPEGGQPKTVGTGAGLSKKDVLPADLSCNGHRVSGEEVEARAPVGGGGASGYWIFRWPPRWMDWCTLCLVCELNAMLSPLSRRHHFVTFTAASHSWLGQLTR